MVYFMKTLPYLFVIWYGQSSVNAFILNIVLESLKGQDLITNEICREQITKALVIALANISPYNIRLSTFASEFLVF